ncbi:hypothetical protein ACGC1H_006318 [Rhizoctonia solani]
MVDYATSILNLTPDGDPCLPTRLGNLGISYGTRFRSRGELDDLENAIKYFHRALVSAPEDHLHLSQWLVDLGTAYCYRFRRLNDPKDLDKAIKYKSRGLALISDDRPDLSRLLAELGEYYSTRFDLQGKLDDLDNATEYESRSISLVPDDHQDLIFRLVNLGRDYHSRFQLLEELDVLDKAIECQSRALTLAPKADSELSAELGTTYIYRFKHLGKQEDFEKAVEHQSRALLLMPDGHSRFPMRLANLGVVYACRFEYMHEPEDLEKSIEYISHAISLAPNGESELPRWHANLGLQYDRRFKRSGEPHDLEKTIEHYSHSITLTPDGDSDLPRIYYNLGNCYFVQYQRTSNPSELKKALESFRKISDPSVGASVNKFLYTICWADRASKHSSLSSSRNEAYHATIDLLPHAIWLSATPKERDLYIGMTKNVAKRAASAAIRSFDYKLALEWLEHARCVMWSQNLMLRSPLDRLHSFDSDLSTRLRETAKQLHNASSELPASFSSPSDSTTPGQIAQCRRDLTKEYNKLLVRARSLPGFEDFIRPTKTNGLLRAARNGPVVVINCCEEWCDALLILPGKDDISHLHLPGFSEEKARHAHSKLEKSIQQYDSDDSNKSEVESPPEPETRTNDRVGHVLATLWKHIVKPVLEFLGYTKNASTDNLPHITWCPTGVLTFLPLHAAGNYEQPRARVFNYVISSYTPTLTALLASTPGSLNCDPRVLAVGQGAGSSRNQLANAIKELACVKNHMTNKAQYSQLIDDQATTTAVLDAMEENDWVHFACHASQNVNHPTKSGFRLHDGVLNLAAINQRSFNNKGLAFLSACETAQGDKRFPDEAVHLASGLLMAGYSSVIGMMWTVYDEDALLVADKVYGRLMKEGKVGNGQAGEALHHAVVELREKLGEREFMRWVPYIHIGS